MAEIDVPKSPPPPRSGTRDDSVETLCKLAGGCCLAVFGCTFGPLLLVSSLTLVTYGFVWLAIISLFVIVLGCYSAKYTWDGIKKNSA